MKFHLQPFATICNHLQQSQAPTHKGFREDVANVANKTQKNTLVVRV